MQIRSLVRAATAAAILGFVAPTVARAQTITTDPLSTGFNAVPGLTSFQTDYNDVGGMLVNWDNAYGGSAAACAAGGCAWGDIGGGNWGVTTTYFKLWRTGTLDTFDNNWYLWAMDLTGFSLQAIPGMGVFDIIKSPDASPGSASGNPFNWSGSDDWNTTALFTNPVGINGAAPVGDLWGTMTVSFGQEEIKSCAAGYDLDGNTCGKFIGYAACDSGYTLTKFGSRWYCYKNSSHYYQATATYDYQAPTVTYQDIVFGDNSKCSETKAYDYDHNSIDNTKCFEKFVQDMDNLPDGGTFTPTDVVPEPASMTLLATGLVGMMAAARRRRSKK